MHPVRPLHGRLSGCMPYELGYTGKRAIQLPSLGEIDRDQGSASVKSGLITASARETDTAYACVGCAMCIPGLSH